jgi:hypothetical protein
MKRRRVRLFAYTLGFTAIDWRGFNGMPSLVCGGCIRVWVRHWSRAARAASFRLVRRGFGKVRLGRVEQG